MADVDESARDELHVGALEATGRYRVLRRIPPLRSAAPGSPSGDEAIGIAIDLETTGLDPEWDEPIELAMVKFTYDRVDGRFLSVLDTFSRSPSRPSRSRPP